MNPAKRPYHKRPLSFEEQAELLIKRGLRADQDELTDFLKRTNYYRFSTYLYPFRQPGSDDFLPGTDFSSVRILYDFDQALRVMLFDALTRLEISMLRTQFVEFFTQRYGPFGYAIPDNFNMPPDKHNRSLLEPIRESVKRSQEEFVKHFQSKYSDEYLPLWMAVEIMSFGNVMTMALQMHHNDKKQFAQRYGLPYVVMDSWLRTLNYIRNCCAHHARLWNRALAIKPTIPDRKNRPEFYEARFHNSRIFAVLTMIQYLLNVIEPKQTWKAEVLALLTRFPDVPIDQMGFPDNWQAMTIWSP